MLSAACARFSLLERDPPHLDPSSGVNLCACLEKSMAKLDSGCPSVALLLCVLPLACGPASLPEKSIAQDQPSAEMPADACQARCEGKADFCGAPDSAS